MRALVQKVDFANLECENYKTSIKKGYIVFLGVKKDDTEKDYQFVLRKIINLRIFHDEAGKVNKSLKDVGGEILLVSQFTLYGCIKNNNRPSFSDSADKDKALNIYERMISDLGKHFPVKTGVFGGHMHITYLNNGPFSIIIDSAVLE